MILITVLFVSLSAISAEQITDDTTISEPINQIDNAILTDGDSTDHYYVSNEGSDDNNGTINSPYKTIEKAVEKTSINKTTNIHLSEGIFQGNGNVNLSLTNNINLIGVSPEKTILDGSNANWLANMDKGILTIKDLTITNFFLNINQTGTNAGIIGVAMMTGV